MRLKYLLLSLILILCLCGTGWGAATINYVDNTVTDTNVGSATPDCTNYSPTTYTCGSGSSRVFASIADINALTLDAGSVVYFRRGQTWEITATTLTADQNGTNLTTGAVTYTNFGDPSAALPNIKGSETLTDSWTQESGNIYWHSYTATNVRGVWQNDTHKQLISKASVVAMTTAGTFFFDSANSKLYVWRYDNAAPGVTIEACQQYSAITSSGDYNIFDGLKITYSPHANGAITNTAGGINCEVKNNIFQYSNTGIKSDSAVIYIHDNQFLNNWTGITYGTSGAEGAGIFLGSNSVSANIYRNYFKANYQNIKTAACKKAIIHHNLLVDPALTSFDYGISTGLVAGDENHFFHNTLLHNPHNTDPAVANGHAIVWQNTSDYLYVYNNIIYMDPSAGVTVFTACAVNTGAGVSAANSREDYNIYYNTGTDSKLFGRDSANYSNAIADHQTNLTNEGVKDFAGTGNGGANDQVIDPRLKSVTRASLLANLSSGSPAINAGVNICTGENAPLVGCTGAGTGTYTDYTGGMIAGTPDIGAYERRGKFLAQ